MQGMDVPELRKEGMGGRYQQDNSTDIPYHNSSDVKWILYNKVHVGYCTRVYYDLTCDVMVMCVIILDKTYTRVT